MENSVEFHGSFRSVTCDSAVDKDAIPIKPEETVTGGADKDFKFAEFEQAVLKSDICFSNFSSHLKKYSMYN